MKIQEVILREIFTSRGEPTLEVSLKVEEQFFSAEIPAGESRGSKEAKALSPGEAKARWDKAKLRLEGEKFGSIRELDDFLIRLDGTPDKSSLGGNAILGMSIAFARALAHKRRLQVWEIIREEFFPWGVVDQPPLIFANFLEGGAHAENNLDIQEYLVIAEPEDVAETTRRLISLYRDLGTALRRERGLKVLPIGDEGGYVLDFKDNCEPVALLDSLLREKNLAGRFRLGLDAAASGFYRSGKYAFGGGDKSREEMEEIYAEYFRKSGNLFSIEDPFAETDAAGFKKLRQDFPERLVVGDDLTVTNPAFVEQYGNTGVISAVIIKPNQIGSVTESCRAIHAARKHGISVIVSHRGEESGDCFIIHLAKAAGAEGVKIGAPVRERILKYNELLRLYNSTN